MSDNANLRAGQWVEVRGAAEILATLDPTGALNGVPFMPEMLPFLGRRMRVHRRADKTCVEGHGLRKLGDAVLLEESRCDGAAHDGCQRGCMIFWPEAWLKPLREVRRAPNFHEEVKARQVLAGLSTRDGELYRCQSTALPTATRRMPRLAYGLIFTDLAHGEIDLAGAAGMIFRTLANKLLRLAGRPELGVIAGPGLKTGKGSLNLRPGEWVRIKSAGEIARTLTPDSRNQGLTFEPEMARHIGAAYQVDQPIEKIILEESGRMVNLKRTVALRDVTCKGVCVKNCPRNNPLFWREAWLERVHPQAELLAAE